MQYLKFPKLALMPLGVAAVAVVATATALPPGSSDPAFDAGIASSTSAGYPYVAAAELPDGSVVLAGPSLAPSGLPRLTRVLPDGRYDYQFGTNLSLSGTINALVYQPGEGLLLGGFMVASKNQGQPGSATMFRLNAGGAVDLSFAVDRSANTYPVTRLKLLPDHSVLIARSVPYFTIPIASRPPMLMKLTPNGAVDPHFRSYLASATSGHGVEAIHVLDDGRILAGGRFLTERSGLDQPQKLVRLMPDGGVDPTFEEPSNVASGTLVNRMAPVEDGLLVSVQTTAGADSLVRLHSDGSEDWFLSDYRLQPSVRYVSGILERPDGHLIISGSAAGTGATNLALVRIRPDGMEDAAYPSRIDQAKGGAVNGLLPLADGGFLAFGNFLLSGKLVRPGFVRVFSDGNPDPNFGRIGAVSSLESRESTAVTSLIPLHDGLLIGGGFQAVDGLPRNRLAKLKLDGSLDLRFVTNVVRNQSELTTKSFGFELPDGRIVLAAAGAYIVGTTNLGTVVRLMPDGSLDSSFHRPAFGSQPGVVAAAMQADGSLLVSGRPRVNGTAHVLGVVRILPDGSLDPDFGLAAPQNLPAYAPVASLMVQSDGRIVVVTPTGLIARYDSSGHREAEFQEFPQATSPKGPTLANLPSGDVYVSGYQVNTTNGPLQLAHWNPDGSFDSHFNFLLRGTVDEVQSSGPDRILVRGTFSPQGHPPQVVRCFGDGSIDRSFAVTDVMGTIHAMAVAGDRLYIAAPGKNAPLSTTYIYDRVARFFNQPAPFSFPVLHEGTGHFITLNFFGAAGRHYVFDASPDLVNWFQIADEAVPTNGIVPLLDDLPRGSKARFYRARPVE